MPWGGQPLNKKAFTLIELLAVIVILAIIALIAVPIVLNLIENVKIKSYDRSVENIEKVTYLYDVRNQLTDNELLMDQNIYDDVTENIEGEKPESGLIYIKASKINNIDEIAFALQYGEWCYTKAYGEEKYTKTKSDNCEVPFDYLVKTKETSEPFLNGPLQRNTIEKVITIPTNQVPTDNSIKGSWDVSEKSNGKVMAWYKDDDNDELYEVYIGQEGGVKANKKSTYLFGGLTKATEIDLTYFDTSNVESMYKMFSNCVNLLNIDLSKWDTSKVTSMFRMFEYCANLTNLNLNSFDTSNVKTMNMMFNGCSKLVELNLSNFNTSSVTNMSGMFSNCSSLSALNINNFKTNLVTDMGSMFCNCKGLTSLNLTNFDTTKVTNMSFMFKNCYLLTTLDLSNFNTGLVTNMNSMFYGTINLKPIYVGENWTTENAIITEMFVANAKTTTVEELCEPGSTEEWCVVN